MAKTQPQNRRKSDMAANEVAYRQGLRRRSSDRDEKYTYYLLLLLVAVAYLFIGLGSYLWG